MMTHVRLTKLSDNKNALRTDVVVGHAPKLPELGSRFEMYAEGVDFGVRHVSTSQVVSYSLSTSNKTTSVFRTESGTEYQLEILQ